MKTTCHNVLKVILCLSVLFIGSCDKESDEKLKPEEAPREYSVQMNSLTNDLIDFITKAQAFETTNFKSKTTKEIQKIIDDYVTSGEKLVETMEKMAEIETLTKAFTKTTVNLRADDPICTAYDAIPGGSLSVGACKNVGDLVKDAREVSKKNADDLQKGVIDEAEYLEKSLKLQKEKTAKAFNMGVAGVIGTGAGIVAAGAASVASAPVIVVVAVGTAVGVAVGAGVSWLARFYSKKTKAGEYDEFLYAGKTTVGGEIPLHLIPEGASVTIAVDGHSPVTIPNIKHPADGMERTLTLENPPKFTEAKAGDKIEVCYMDRPMVANTCADVSFVSGSPHPTDPGPFQDVTVTATLTPAVAGCTISFSIVGTDGYSNQATKQSDSKGQATFYIPGGAESVFDKVTITASNGKTYTVTYTF